MQQEQQEGEAKGHQLPALPHSHQQPRAVLTRGHLLIKTVVEVVGMLEQVEVEVRGRRKTR
jgi:hypothetical protein